MQFQLILKNEKTKLYHGFAIFIFILNVAAIIYFLYSRNEKIISSSNSFIALFLLINSLLIYIIASFKKKKQLAFFSPVIGIFFCWILIGYWWISLIMAIFSFLYKISKRQLKAGFGDQIIYPSFPKRFIKWKELNNVILKDGLLTMDFKNNKIIQQLIKYPNTVNEKEFNEFCNQQLKSATSV